MGCQSVDSDLYMMFMRLSVWKAIVKFAIASKLRSNAARCAAVVYESGSSTVGRFVSGVLLMALANFSAAS
jgi:hypothetical protein